MAVLRSIQRKVRQAAVNLVLAARVYHEDGPLGMFGLRGAMPAYFKGRS